MRSTATLALLVASLPLFVACATGDGPDFGTGAASGSGGADGGSTTHSSSSGSTSSGGDVPTTCAQADQSVGCCTSAGVLYYCSSTGTLTSKTCTSGDVCGWDASKSYYDCVAPPGGADPNMTSPLLCP